MSETILICGYGPGISHAIAERFGREGFRLALVARSADKVETAARTLREAGFQAIGFARDLGSPDAVRALVADVRAALGPITVVQWNAYGGGAGDFVSADLAELDAVLAVNVTGLLAAVQAALPDLQAQPGRSAVLVTGGGLSQYHEQAEAMAVQWGAMGLALGKAAQHKTVRLLHQRLAGSVYVGEVTVMGAVKGTSFDAGQATLEASTIAERFWQLFRERQQVAVPVG